MNFFTTNAKEINYKTKYMKIPVCCPYVLIHQYTRRHLPKDSNFLTYSSQNFKYGLEIIVPLLVSTAMNCIKLFQSHQMKNLAYIH